MVEILKLIPATAWSAIVTAILTSSVAFIGISYTNKQNLKRMKLQHEHEIKIRDHEVIRERAEELFVGIKSFGRNMITTHMPYHSAMIGKITFNQALDMTIESGKTLDYDVSRIHMLADVYFPKIAKELDELIEFNGTIYSLQNKFKEKYKRGITKDEVAAKEFLEQNDKLIEKVRNLESNVAAECRNL